MNLKNQRGAITLFVLASCLFFIASVVCVRIYMQSKEININGEYREIKENYEGNEEERNKKYNELASQNNLTVNFETPQINWEAHTITVGVSVDLDYLKIKTFKYGWYYSPTEINDPSASNITNWIYQEKQEGVNNFAVIMDNIIDNTSGYYYLCVMIDGKDYWKGCHIVVQNVAIS